tara:strand:+ start:360 stop:632 length:273 start_codon:yes stop_codon:yes gene_type:complete
MSIQLKIPFPNFRYSNSPELSYWSYRIIQKENPSGISTYGIYVVDYDIEGNFLRHAKKPISDIFESVEGLKEDIERLNSSVDKDVLTYQN